MFAPQGPEPIVAIKAGKCKVEPHRDEAKRAAGKLWIRDSRAGPRAGGRCFSGSRLLPSYDTRSYECALLVSLSFDRISILSVEGAERAHRADMG